MPLNIEIEAQDCESLTLEITKGFGTQGYESLTLEIDDGFGVVPISSEPYNRLEVKPDGLYVRDQLEPDPVAYYLLSRG